MNKTPRVSIVTATRNRPELLVRAVESVFTQTFTDFELLITDDGSSAETFSVYDDLAHRFGNRLRIVARRESDRGGNPAITRNRGIDAAQGEFVAFLDDDDVWIETDHLEVGVLSLERHAGDYYFANLRTERDGRVVASDCFPNSPALKSEGCLNPSTAVYEVPLRHMMKVMRHHLIHPDIAIMRRRLLIDIGGFCERIVFSEDYDLMMRAADRAAKVLYRDKCVVAYRLPTTDSHSQRVSPLHQILDRLAAAQHVLAVCTNSAVRHAARAREAWTLRELAGEMTRSGQYGAALSFGWQALAVFPTIGGFHSLATTAVLLAICGIRNRRMDVVSDKWVDIAAHPSR